MEPGTFCFHYAVMTGADSHKVSVSVDVLIQPKIPRKNKLPIMVEAKSAGDFTNTNKRRKEEAKKISQLKGVESSHSGKMRRITEIFERSRGSVGRLGDN